MSRGFVMGAGLVVLLLASITLGQPSAMTEAQSGTPAAGFSGFAGAYRLAVSNPGRTPVLGAMTFASDGTVQVAVPPVQPAQVGSAATLIVASTGLGVWRADSATTASVTFVLVESDLKGVEVAVVTVHGMAELGMVQRPDCPRGALCAPVPGFRGEFTTTITDPNGQILATVNGTWQGARLTVESAAPPGAGTPAT